MDAICSCNNQKPAIMEIETGGFTPATANDIRARIQIICANCLGIVERLNRRIPGE